MSDFGSMLRRNEIGRTTTTTTWSENVNEQYQPFVSSLLNQCDWSWIRSTMFTPKQIADYQLFILCKVVANDFKIAPGSSRLRLSPTIDIDEVWHQHLLRPVSYFGMCSKLYQLQQNRNDADGTEERGSESFQDCLIDHTPESEADSDHDKFLRFLETNRYANLICPGYIFSNPPQTLSTTVPSIPTKRVDRNCVPLDPIKILRKKSNDGNPGGKARNTFSISLTIQTLTGKVFQLQGMKSNDSVAHLMERIQNREGIPPDQQILIIYGKQLEKDASLDDSHVVDGSVITLVLKLKGC